MKSHHTIILLISAVLLPGLRITPYGSGSIAVKGPAAVAVSRIHDAIAYDESAPLLSMVEGLKTKEIRKRKTGSVFSEHDFAVPFTSASIEQTTQGTRPPPEIVAWFDGLGEGFEGPQGSARFRNPSDNSIAVGPDHIVQTVNSRMAVYTKKGSKFDVTGRVLYGPVPTNNVFKGFGDADTVNNGDAVVRYDQLADRWMIVMPIFRRLTPRPNPQPVPKPGEPPHLSQQAVDGQPGPAQKLFQPAPPTPEEKAAADSAFAALRDRFRQQGGRRPPQNPDGQYAMCYAISTTSDPLGSYYRYEFVRPLFPDYPRPAVWPDGYYVPTSTGDEVIQKHAYVVERLKMLRGESAREVGVIIDSVNFLNNADLDGMQLPPPGSPNIMMAAGGMQLKNIL